MSHSKSHTHRNVRITYPDNPEDPVICEVVSGQEIRIDFLNDPTLLKYIHEGLADKGQFDFTVKLVVKPANQLR